MADKAPSTEDRLRLVEKTLDVFHRLTGRDARSIAEAEIAAEDEAAEAAKKEKS